MVLKGVKIVVGANSLGKHTKTNIKWNEENLNLCVLRKVNPLYNSSK